MSEQLVNHVQEMLKEESWTRAAISGYTQKNMEELAEILDQARSEGCTFEVKEICEEHLTHSKDSIIALYIVGILDLESGSLDNAPLKKLVEFFQKNHKEQIANHLCETIIEKDPNNKFALRTLALYYKENNDEKMWEFYEKIVRLDFNEADMAKALAEHIEATSKADDKKKREEATDYYKKAILRYVTAKNFSAIKEIWTKLISLLDGELDFFLLVQRKVAKTMDSEKSITLLTELYNKVKEKAEKEDKENSSKNSEKWDTALSLIKMILQLDPNDKWARSEIVKCYRGKYRGHTKLDKYIRASDLELSIRNVFDSINNFEKHIAFDVKKFVFHKSWGIGKIIEVKDNDHLAIKFQSGTKDMSTEMAISSLAPLSDDHIWVKKATTRDRAAFIKQIKEDKVGTLETIIKSFDNSCDFKRIKAELEGFLSKNEMTSWTSAAKQILESDSRFGVNPNDITKYMVRGPKTSKEDKYSNEFKAQKQFFARIDIFMRFVKDELTDKESDLFADMYNYFTGFIQKVTKVTEQIMGSYLVVQKIGTMYPQHKFACKYTFKQLYEDIENPREMYTLLKDTKATTLKEDFLANIRENLPDWSREYIRLFPTVLKMKLITELEAAGKKDDLRKMTINMYENYKDFREAILFLFENCQECEWYKNSNVSYEKQLITILNIIDLTAREKLNHVNTTENTKINSHAKELLFDKEAFVNYIFSKDEATVTKMYTLVDDIEDIEGKKKSKIRSLIIEHYPDYKFHTVEEKKEAPKGMIVTAKKLDEKKAELEHMQKVEVPANAKEIQEAREQGDLKENSEYKAAKEHQHYLSVKISRLQEEMERATVFDETMRTTAIVSFGTKVTLLNKRTNQNETYTILGPWESDPENGVISYLSPFGNSIMDRRVNEDLNFSINDNDYEYKVISIEAAQF